MASAQTFVGSDNFDSGTLAVDTQTGIQSGVWSASQPDALGSGGALKVVNQHLEYTTSTATGTNRGQLTRIFPYESISPGGGTGLSSGYPYTSSWVAQVDVTNLTTGFTSGSTSAELLVFTASDANDSDNAAYGISLTNSGGNMIIYPGWSYYDTTSSTWMTGGGSYPQIDVSGHTQATLRLSFDASTDVLTESYSLDGGINFVSGGSFALAGAQAGNVAPYNNGMGLAIFGQSDNAGAISSGQLTFDNFSVSAVPEPASDSVLAGILALGLVVSGKRRRHRKA